MVRRLLWSVALAGLCWGAPVPALADASGFAGTWKGPWYRGMTSGVMTLKVDAKGAGTLQFTNLENFGTEAVVLDKFEAGGESIKFSASGERGSDFSARATRASSGKMVRGEGSFEGFPVRFELKRAN